jgi:multidrug efflux pump subunit AcrB
MAAAWNRPRSITLTAQTFLLGVTLMSLRFQIAALVFAMAQGVLFGIGTVLVLATPLAKEAMTLMPWVVGISIVISAPLSWAIAPRLRARYWRDHKDDQSFLAKL